MAEECSQYELSENYMQQLLLAEEKSSVHEARSWVPRRQSGAGCRLCARLGHDAQPVSPLDAAILAQRYLRRNSSPGRGTAPTHHLFPGSPASGPPPPPQC